MHGWTFSAALLLLGTASAAQAAEPPARVVRYGGLDLSTPRGARLMVIRLDAAALEVCGGGRTSLREVNRAVRAGRCWRAATTQALAQVRAPRLTAAWTASFGAGALASGPTAGEPAAGR